MCFFKLFCYNTNNIIFLQNLDLDLIATRIGLRRVRMFQRELDALLDNYGLIFNRRNGKGESFF